MREHDEARNDAEWRILHARITEALDRFGTKDAFGKGDYWLVDDNWGDYRHKVEIQNLAMLRPNVIMLLQGLLHGYPDWEITVQVDVVGKEKEWPGMGLIIHDNEIIDELLREFLPAEFRDYRYEAN